MGEKKFLGSLVGMGYCSFFQYESRYNGLYRDLGQLGATAGATTKPRLSHDTVEHAPRNGHSTTMTRPGGLRYGRPGRRVSGMRARAWPLGVSVAIQKIVSWLGRPLGCDTASGNAAIRQRARATRHCAHTTWRVVHAAGDSSRDTKKLYRD